MQVTVKENKKKIILNVISFNNISPGKVYIPIISE